LVSAIATGAVPITLATLPFVAVVELIEAVPVPVVFKAMAIDGSGEQAIFYET